jgi:hypothetical protein
MMNTNTGVALRKEAGFSIIEVMIATMLLMIVTGVVLQGMLSLTTLSDVVANRSEMHAGVRNATSLLQQEVGQAGRVALPAAATLAGPVGVGAATVEISPSTDGIFVGELLVVGTGDLEETITVTAVNNADDEITATFGMAHAANVPVSAPGGFAAGVIPTTMANGSTASLLKIVGDINGSGKMVYVEYTCDTDGGFLYRNSMPFDAVAKPEVTVEDVLIDNIQPNPDDSDCFIYDERVVGGNTYVVGVAITLTVRTQERDPITQQFQTETKALLNVAPRNVFHSWQLASLGYTERIQTLPPSVTALLPTEE